VETAGVAVAIDRLARLRGLRENFTLIWNANNTTAGSTSTSPHCGRRGDYRREQIYEVRAGATACVARDPERIDSRLLSGADPKLLAK